MKIFFDEIDHFHPNFDESVPNHFMSGRRRRVRRRVVDTDSDSEMPTTVPASSGTVRRLA